MLLHNILIKPAGPGCNMRCRYCFYLKKADMFGQTTPFRMTETILKETIRQVMEQGGRQVSVGWQGGEPTLMGLPFYKKAVEYQKRFARGQAIGNGFQTNGLLINDDWASFFLNFNFLVGLSLDGPKHVHNRYRRLAGGGSSWEKVQDAAKRLLDAGVAVNALVVVSDYAVKFPAEIYNYHKNLGLNHMQFIPCVERDLDNGGGPTTFSAPPVAYGRFLMALFDLWLADFKNGLPTTSIRFFESVLYCYLGLPAPECTLQPECGTYLVVEHNGDVYPCDFFVEPKERLGNVMKDSLFDLLNSDRQQAFGRRRVDMPPACRRCQWLSYCFGGCPKDRIHRVGDFYKNHLCESYRNFFEYADERLHQIAEHRTRKNANIIGYP